MTELASDVRAIDTAVLAPMVTLALRQERVEIVDWTSAPFGHSHGDTHGPVRSIVRFSGTARAAGHVVPWALVLKIVPMARTADDPASPDNGEREPLAYGLGLLDRVAPLHAPRCFGTSERPDGQFWLWLEEVGDDIGRVWPPERYMLAARDLGRFNASHPAGAAALSYPWLSRSPLREAVREISSIVARLSEARDHPVAAEAIPPASATALLAAVRRSDAWLDEMDRLPQLLCHWDAHRANLFSRTAPGGEVQTVAIDWAGVGWGPPGADLSKLLSQTVNFFGLDAGSLRDLDAALFEHYVDGLREGGWRGDGRVARFGYTAACAMRLIIRTAAALRLIFDERARASFERATGEPLAALAQRFAQTLPYYLSLAEEADRLSGVA